MLIYADGSALSRSLTGDAESDSWLRWATEHADQIVTSPLALTEVRRAADPLGPVAREKARALAGSVTVIRFSDQSLRSATVAASVLPPFAAIHLGIALTRVEIGAIATYDKPLAQVAALHQLAACTGRPRVQRTTSLRAGRPGPSREGATRRATGLAEWARAASADDGEEGWLSGRKRRS